MEPDINTILSTLSSAVEVILSPSASASDRQRAHEVCEQFKENSPHCIQCGLALAERQYSPIIRHFGIQLLEHCIKFRWHKLGQEEKEALKRKSLLLISEGTAGILKEESHIKDAVSRLIVEIIKHEWPNLWPSLFSDLHTLCQMGPTQTELVLKVFLRLVEDIVVFQNLVSTRRREIMVALTTIMGDMFEMFINILQENTDMAAKLEQSQADEDKLACQCHTKVSEVTLMTLSGFLDWVAMVYILHRDSILLQMLCLLLSNSALQLAAAECLLIIISRRGKLEERKPLLILFHEGAMSTIWNAAVVAERASTDDHFYLFLKKLCQILVEMGKQLCFLWGSEASPDVSQPPNFAKYLEALLAFTQHPSKMLSSLTLHLWATFLRHEKIAKDPVFLGFVPRIFETATKTLIKVGFPSQSNSPSCNYARLDFDNDEEFSMFFSKYRAETSETLRQATLLEPSLGFNYAAQWLSVVLEKPVDSGADIKSGNCNLSSPSFLEWDALTVFLESVMSKITLTDQPQGDIEKGITLLKSVLQFETQDPLILSSLLSCISALFTFLTYTPDTLATVLIKIFSAVVFSLPGQTKSTRSRAVKNVRQHACSGLVKICKQHQELVFPVFDELYKHIQHIGSDRDQLSQMERCILTESLILVSNQFNNFEKQSSFLEEVTKPVKELWLSEEFIKAFVSTDKFMSYVGLDQPPVEPSSADTCGINRSHITYCVHMILAVMKRSQWPADVEKAKAGSFVLGTSENGDCIMRNPATSHVSILLENVLALLRVMNQLWCEEYLKLRHHDFDKSYDLSENDKQVLLGIPPPCVDNSGAPNLKHPLERMQNFLATSHSISCHILGNAGQCLGSEFYALPTLAQSIAQTALAHMDTLPDYRLRSIIRVFLKPYVLHCPSQYYSTALLPLLASICPYMFQRLSKAWQMINQRCQERTQTGVAEEDLETQEVLEEQLARQLTRDYMDLLSAICFNKRSDPIEDTMLEDVENMAQPQARDLGLLGQQCLQSEVICESLVLCVFNGLSWNDTPTLNKCVSLSFPIVKQLLVDSNLSGAAAAHFYCGVLSSLQVHGHNQSGQAMLIGLGVQMYELLRPRFEEVGSLMLQIPKCTDSALKSFDDKFLNGNGPQKLGERKKKEAYKKLVAEIIGKDIGEQFRRKVHYKSLPNLFRRPKPVKPTLDEVEQKDMGLCTLFKPETDKTVEL